MLETKRYSLTVEGETEKWYFEWLEKEINKVESRKYNASFKIKVEQSPRSFYKGTNFKTTPFAFHILDVESRDEYHTKKFKDTLKEMKEANTQKNIKYYLGYSNFTFELWIILHKRDCYLEFNHRKDYLPYIQKCFNEKFKKLDEYKKEKNFKRCLDKLTLNDVKDALKRADKIEELNKEKENKLIKYSGYSYYENNPSLSINKLIEKIFKECNV